MVALMLGLAACGQGTTSRAEGVAGTAADPILVEKPRLSADIEAMPRLSGDSPAIVRINAELDRLDATAVADAGECGRMADSQEGDGWTRTITRPMTGPAYLTLREHLEIFCGGAYPSTSQTPITWDLSTGERVNWVALLPGLGLVQDQAEEGMPTDYVYSVRSPRLETLYERKMLAEATDAEWREQCRDVWTPKPGDELGQGFRVWADAEHGGVAIDADYAHVVQACGGTVYLTADEMREAGAPAALIDALAAGKTAGNWAPREDAEAAE
ncbi:MAG: hypothetical protein B7Y86_06880 [Brevundimonas subvibrioides]|uniref:Uncharacterized protein n=1 Tax=Brevundimonas subvibrioides TaxID=74313 RepID=A0A258HKA8_9CAUL|nr:MAG: hypothetical protein B7Y86_06880 [Brevundimonas subvibrioides]